MEMPLAPDQLRSRALLGTEATYRVVAVEGRDVLVEVVDVPGLAPGMRLRLSRSAVEAMDLRDVRAEVDASLRALLASAA